MRSSSVKEAMMAWIIGGVVVVLLIWVAKNVRVSGGVPSEAVYQAAMTRYGLTETDEAVMRARDVALGGNKIEAIKALRAKTGMELKEAKDIVDFLSAPVSAKADRS